MSRIPTAPWKAAISATFPGMRLRTPTDQCPQAVRTVDGAPMGTEFVLFDFDGVIANTEESNAAYLEKDPVGLWNPTDG